MDTTTDMVTDFDIQLFDNPQPRCACTLVLDTSHSMLGQPIQELNDGVRRFFDAVICDDFARFSVETSIITFGGRVDTAMQFTSCADKLSVAAPTLKGTGCTPLGRALDAAIDALDQRTDTYRQAGIPFYKPWLVLMTDGAPNDQWQSAADRLNDLSGRDQMVVIGVGIGADVDMATLTQICPANRPPKRLDGLAFGEFFEWLSQSMAAVSHSSMDDAVPLPPTDGWVAI